MTAAELNKRFGGPEITFRDAGEGFVFIDVDNPWGRAEISLYGGQVLTFQSVGGRPVLWMSDDARLERGTAIRGGIPICWPWFGPHPDQDDCPSHGFVRTRDWTVQEAVSIDSGSRLVLTLEDSEETRGLWPYAFKLTLSITVGIALDLELKTENKSPEPFTVTQALHSYFAVGDIYETTVLGLEDTRYLDAMDGFSTKEDHAPISFTGETDRDYFGTAADCIIHDPVLGRDLRVSKTGSNSTVVWNPWIDKAKRMTDFPDDAFPGMVCVETANATEYDTVTVEPNGTHLLTARITVE